MTLHEDVPTWPEIKATIDHTGTGVVMLNGVSFPIATANPEAAREAVRTFVIIEAAIKLNRPVRLSTTDHTGQWDLIVHPDGTVNDATPPKRRQIPSPRPVVPEPTPIPEAISDPHVWGSHLKAGNPSTVMSTQQHPPQTVVGRGEISSEPLDLRPSQVPSFLQQSTIERPATLGMRGVLTRVGLKTAPSDTERAQRDDARTVSQHWPSTRTIAIVNGKGGANKTPTTALLSAVFARYGGAGVLAWDNNETRGTLGWRTEEGPHNAHVHDLLRNAADLQTIDAHLGAIDAYVHHQSRDRYAVLRSNPELLAQVSRLSEKSFDTIHQVALRYFRLIFVDSGNDESSQNWQRMIDCSDAIVVASTTRPEHAEAARLLLDALYRRDQRSAQLAANATVIISQADKEEASAPKIAEAFSQYVRSAVVIPYDRAMRAQHLAFDTLNPATARAWLHAGAQVAAAL